MRWIKLVALAVLLFLPIHMCAEEAIPERSFELGAQYNDPVLTQKWEQEREYVYIISDGITRIPQHAYLRNHAPYSYEFRHLICVPDSMQDIEALREINKVDTSWYRRLTPNFNQSMAMSTRKMARRSCCLRGDSASMNSKFQRALQRSPFMH